MNTNAIQKENFTFCIPEYRKAKQNQCGIDPASCGIKWNYTQMLSKREISIPNNIIPLWIADMDVKVSPAIYQALHEVTEHKIFGYTREPHTLQETVCKWVEQQHNWKTSPDEFVFSTATITALQFLLHVITQEDDEIIVQQPVYPPLSACIEAHKRVLKINTLTQDDQGYKMNMDELESLICSKTKMLILCNPQNPTGRMWNKTELEQVLALCKKHGIYIYSDDVHADIAYAPHRYTPIVSITNSYDDNIMTAYSAAKAFSIPGLHISILHIKNKQIREMFLKMQQKYIGNTILSPYAIAAQEAAYNGSKDWLQSIIQALQKNRDMLITYIRKHLPAIRVHQPEGTFLLWLDFSTLGLKEHDLFDLIYTKAKLGLSCGKDYGISGSQCMRLNFACDPQLLQESMNNLHNAINTI